MSSTWPLSSSCSPPHLNPFLPWIGFALLSPCSHHASFLALHLCFFIAFLSKWLLLSNTHKLTTFRFKRLGTSPTAILSCLLFISLLATLALAAWHVLLDANPTGSRLLLFVHAIAWFFFFSVSFHAVNYTLTFPKLIQTWWVLSFVLVTLQCSCATYRLGKTGFGYALSLRIDDIFAILTFLVNAILAVIAIRGVDANAWNDTTFMEPLLSNGSQNNVICAPTTEYANAGFISKVTFSWIYPILNKGSKNILQIGDIPQLAPYDKAENTHCRLQSSWPKHATDYPVRWALLKCFWRPLAFTGFLALLRLSVMFVGPILIQSFVDFTQGKKHFDYEGYVLVLILLAAKLMEVLVSHQYNFLNQKLGNNIRSSLIVLIYRKGLRLSSSARQTHGVGQIVNYMSVDVQQLSDVILQIHYIWLMPLQIAVALGILYGVVGISMLSGFITIIIVIGITLYTTKKQRFFLRQIMGRRDVRMKATNEVLNYIKVIKLQAWEEYFRNRVETFRLTEYSALAKFMYTLAGTIFTLWSTPTLVSTITFASCILLTTELTPGKVFTATSTFRILQEPIRNFPQSLISISQALVSLDRLDRFLLSKELEPTAVTRLPLGEHVTVAVERGFFTWDEDEKRPILHDINFSIKRGSIVAVVGAVGSGKSSLLACILGEMPKLSGKVVLSGNTAYVPQTAWIQNGTIQENILFGLPMNAMKYEEAIRSCALGQDLALMEYGDQTEIGERGINMSGGQKQRIQLARAVYQDSDIYLLDDIFSAVDAHTGSEIFKECILGVLDGKTIILVTHQVDFLHKADLILVMDHGEVVQTGKYSEILHPGTKFEALVTAHRDAMGLVVREIPREGLAETKKEQISYEKTNSLVGIQKKNAESLHITETLGAPINRKAPVKLIDEEERGKGHVGRKVYWLYLTKAFGWPLIFLIVASQALWQTFSILSDYWLAEQTNKAHLQTFNPWLFIRVYFFLSLGGWVCLALRALLTAVFGLNTAQQFYLAMFRAILRAPMSYFDTTPSGRILSRSSTDQANVDIFLPFFFGGCIAMYISAVGVLIVTCQITWPVIFVVLPLAWVYFWYQTFYINSSREITRMDSITKAPVIHHFSETIAGFVTIRCFGKEEIFSQVNLERVNSNLKMDFHNIAANEWLGFRLEMIGTVVLCSAALFLVTLPNDVIKPELVGLSLSYGLILNGLLFWSVWMACMIENKMVSVERIRQYMNVPSEAQMVIENCLPHSNWPSEGMIVLKNLQLRYRPHTPLVLKGISLTVEGGYKIGVVGRTGSGKSTLVQAIFRLVEPSSGQILIDKVDITTIGLHDLRSKLGIIPQDPVLFEGTVRTNIDPLGQYSNEEIWEALRKCQMAEVVQSMQSLDSAVVDGGENWSMGQRQLLCLGRALLKRSRLLFLDEATASIDAHTDGILQKIIRQEFIFSTVVSIAHRLPTVMDCDKVIVMDAGYVKEYDMPSKLLEDPSTLFASLVKEYTSK